LKNFIYPVAENIGAGSSAKKDGALKRLWNEVKILHRHPCFVLNTFATTPIQAAVGAFTFWGPKVRISPSVLHNQVASARLMASDTRQILSFIHPDAEPWL